MIRALSCACALTWASGCALVHERDAGPVDAWVFDGMTGLDAPISRTDVGPVTHCAEFWHALPTCPAVTDRAIGQPCFVEGQSCGEHCCEPGPPIACRGGRWAPLDRADDCSGVRCRGPRACFDGMCAWGDVCVLSTGELASVPSCVRLPDPVEFECAVPAGSLDADPSSCTTCTCRPGEDQQSIVTIDCACC